MNSEKVKEIKKALECCSEGKCEKCLIGKKDIRKCVDILLKDTLTLINELESENERLSDDIKFQQMTDKAYKYNMACENGKQIKQISELKEENKQLKAQIVELEKDNELLRNAKVVYETVDYCYEDLKKAEKRISELETKNEVLCVELSRYTENCVEMKNGTLKQFAERLKEQIKAKVDYYNDEVFDYSYNGITEKDIDETLKEF